MITYSFDSSITYINEWAIVQLPSHISQALPSKGMNMGTILIESISFVAVIEPDGNKGHWCHIPETRLTTINTISKPSISISLKLLDDWPNPPLSDDLTSALRDACLMETWAHLTPKAQWEWLRWINFTANPKTTKKRIQTTCDMLSKGKKRPCCFDYSRCTETAVCKGGQLLLTDQDT